MQNSGLSLACGTKGQRVEIRRNPEPRPCEEILEDRTNRWKKASLLGFHQNAQDPNHGKTKPCGDLSGAALIYEQKVGLKVQSEHDRLRFPTIQLAAESAD